MSTRRCPAPPAPGPLLLLPLPLATTSFQGGTLVAHTWANATSKTTSQPKLAQARPEKTS